MAFTRGGRMNKFFKQLFCNHQYKFLGRKDYYFEFETGEERYIPIELLECEKCGKRQIIKYSNWLYRDAEIRKFKLWEQGKIELKIEGKAFD